MPSKPRPITVDDVYSKPGYLFRRMQQIAVSIFMEEFNASGAHSRSTMSRACSRIWKTMTSLTPSWHGRRSSRLRPSPADGLALPVGLVLRHRLQLRLQCVLHPQQIAAGRAFYNYEYAHPGLEDRSGDSVFVKDDAGQIFHTYSTYGRGGEEFLGIYRYLDATPIGRGENGPHHMLADWVRPSNMYGRGGMVEANGRYHTPGCACSAHQQDYVWDAADPSGHRVDGHAIADASEGQFLRLGIHPAR